MRRTWRRCITIMIITGGCLCSCIDGERKAGSFIASPEDTVRQGTWNTAYVRDYNYAEGRVFDLAYPGEIGPYDRVATVWIFQEDVRPNPFAIEVYLQTGPLDPDGTWDHQEISMQDISEYTEWEIWYGQDTSHCPIALVLNESNRRALGIIAEITRCNSDGSPTGVIDTIGHISTGPESDTVRVLQPLSQDMMPENPAWSLMWRNCYRIPKGVMIDDFELRILKAPPGLEGTPSNLDYQEINGLVGDPYIEILGLDQWDNDNLTKYPDGKFDPMLAIYREDWGLVIFPHRTPFNTDTTYVNEDGLMSDELAEKIPSLYNYYSRSEKLNASLYYLEINYWQPLFIR